jgi:hypothetical protein
MPSMIQWVDWGVVCQELPCRLGMDLPWWGQCWLSGRDQALSGLPHVSKTVKQRGKGDGKNKGGKKGKKQKEKRGQGEKP